MAGDKPRTGPIPTPDRTVEWNEEKWGKWPGEWPERMVVWDLETTGLHHSPKTGAPHRIVDIAAVEIINGEVTREYQQYVNPERDVPFHAVRVHGLTERFLKDFPTFSGVAQDFLDFINTDSRTGKKAEDTYLIAHNSRFDLGFMNAELERAGMEQIPEERSLCSLQYARKIRPDLQKHDLDTLANEYGIDIKDRAHTHRALSCSQILSAVQFELLNKAREEGLETFPGVPAPNAQPESQLDAMASRRSFDEAALEEQRLQEAHLRCHGPAPVRHAADREEGHAARIARERTAPPQGAGISH